ncbi:MAG: hypothetical protein AB2531_15070 [Candidatus Thiodiazotropha sp.]
MLTHVLAAGIMESGNISQENSERITPSVINITAAIKTQALREVQGWSVNKEYIPQFLSGFKSSG